MRARRAKLSDVSAIYDLIAHYAGRGCCFHAPRRDTTQHRPLLVQLNSEHLILSCLSLEKYGAELAEIRSIAVGSRKSADAAFGAKLITFALQEARDARIARVFAVTHAPEFFERQGFTLRPRKLMVTRKSSATAALARSTARVSSSP